VDLATLWLISIIQLTQFYFAVNEVYIKSVTHKTDLYNIFSFNN
jgi:hypothetical protein